VTLGETFVNLELINEGLAKVDEAGSGLACGAVFAGAGRAAQNDKAGQWSLSGTPGSP